MDFKDVVAKKVSDVEKPPLPPVGTYEWQIMKQPTQNTSGDGKWDFVTFFCRAVSPYDDVDMEGYPGDPANITMPKSFVFNKEDEAEFEKTLYNMTSFLQNHVQCADEDMGIGEAMNASVNGRFAGTVRWKPNKQNPEEFDAEIGRTAPVE